MENLYELLKQKAIEDCKAGRFIEAGEKLSSLIDVLKQQGAPLASSPTMYWYLVARHKGDEKKAMDEFLKL
jgi:hypothetical protein